jgi:putative restriction endonuclease
MTKAIFTTKVDPTYRDLPESWYHFPRSYLRAVESTVGDWIIYYEPRRVGNDPGSRGGRQAYFATAQVTAVRPDHQSNDLFYADVKDFLPFDRPVPFKDEDRFYERGLRRSDGGTSKGAFGRAVRPISDQEHDLIVRAGFAELLNPKPTDHFPKHMGFAEEPEIFERPVVERVINRPFRDAVFSSSVKSAYADTCAITGLKIINGGGRSEVQAAHIRPVSDFGPDSVRNGVALCSTVHWMFDRGLLSLDDDFTILTATERVPETIRRLVNPGGKLLLPNQPEFRPHPQFLKYHRETVFKG